MSKRVGVVELIQELNPTFNVDMVLNSILTTFILSHLLCVILLIGFRTNWSYSDLVTISIGQDIFYSHTIDCLFLCIAFSIVAPLLGLGATRQYSAEPLRKLEPSEEEEGNRSSCSCFKCYYMCFDSRGRKDYKSLLSVPGSDEEQGTIEKPSASSSYNSHSALGGGQPLLAAFNQDQLSAAAVAVDNSPIGNEGYESEEQAKSDATKLESELRLNDTKTKNNTRDRWMVLLFACSTFSQIYLGVKCISFEFGSQEKRDGALMGLGVLWINLIVWTIREKVARASRELGEFLPLLHPHRLHLNLIVSGHWCDQCRQPCNGGKAYRCNLCDFDLCLVCFAKRDRLNLEGQIRTDKGVKTSDGLTSMQYFWRGLDLVRTETPLFLLAVFFLLLANGSSLVAPTIQGSILDAVVKSDRSKFQTWVQLYVLISLASAVFSSIRGLCFNVIGRRLTNTLRVQLFKGIIVQDTAFFDGNHSGELTSRLSNDVSFMTSPIQTMLSTLISNVILLFGGVAMCFYVSWRLSMLAFTTVGPIIYITQTYAAWSKDLNHQIYAALGKANSIAIEALVNIRLVKSVNAERSEERKYIEANDVALSKGVTDAIGGAGMYTLNISLDLFASVMILWYGGTLAMNNEDGLTAGRLITYQLYWNMMNGSYNALLDILTTLTRAGGAAQRVFSLIDSLPDIDLDSGNPLSMMSFKGGIELQNVSFAYQMRPDKQVLSNVSISIPPGSTCALVGRSGGGKSTIVNMLLRFYDPLSGCIRLDGKDIRETRLRDYRQLIGVVQQNSELFQGTIEENITYGLEPGTWTQESVINAAKKACAHDFIKSFSEGYATRVGERGVRISGGQKQRIAIARAFLRKPRILLLDEATSALDAESEAQVQFALDNLMAEKGCQCTVILVAHRLSTVINADQICVVNDGMICEVGSHEVLYAMQGVYFNLVQRQLKKKNEIVDADSNN